MRKLIDIPVGHKEHTPLARTVIAVLSRRVEGWCIYLGGVPGKSHDVEWQEVAAHGVKQDPVVADAILRRQFFYDPEGVPYAK